MNKKIEFDVQLNWLTGSKGILRADDANGTIHVATPPAFGGTGHPWTPEHIFLGSISSCFMTTFLAIAKKYNAHFVAIECHAKAEVTLKEGKYGFGEIDIFPVVTITSETEKEKILQVLEKTKKHCIIGNSVCTPLVYLSKIIVQDSHTVKEP